MEHNILYCEKCHLLNEERCCRLCGDKNMRAPAKEDYCFLVEKDWMFAEMFKGVLEEEKIPYVDYPSGNGVRSQFALRLENLKIYIVYEFFDKAKQLLNEIISNFRQAQRNDLEKNIAKLYVQRRAEKRIKKRLGLLESDSLTDYCADRIINADTIDNRGRISGCTKGGEYLFIYKANETFIINSATYEIISAEKKPKK